MGLFDRFKKSAGDIKEKAADLADEHGGKVKDGIDKAADFVDDKTGGKYDEHIDKGADAAKDAVEKLEGD